VKRVNNIYDKITNLQVIMSIYNQQIRLNTKNKIKIENFEHYLMLNLVNIQNMLIQEKVIFNKYYIFLIYDPKYRIVMSQSINDKIINHLVAKYFLLDVFEKSLIDSNVATRKNKGTIYGIKLIKRYINELKKKKQPIYYLKCDIKKYFYNIDHNKLKEIMRTKIKDKKALLLIDKIIDTSDKEYISNEVNDICQREINRINALNLNAIDKKRKINELQKIMHARAPGKGIPIGNMTSQAFAIIYLNSFDHFIKEKLHAKYYLRYMDDIIIMDTNKERLKEILKIITNKLQIEYLLEFNDKTKIGMLKDGLDCLGFRFILDKNKLYLRVRTITKKRFKKKIKKMTKLVSEQKMAVEKLNQVLASYKGHLQVGNTYHLYYQVSRNNSLKIDLGYRVYINEQGEIVKG